jgi:hypothetical protein
VIRTRTLSVPRRSMDFPTEIPKSWEQIRANPAEAEGVSTATLQTDVTPAHTNRNSQYEHELNSAVLQLPLSPGATG